MTPSHQRVEKPWGYEDLIEVNRRYVVKKLYMERGHRCSLQYHEVKHETIVVLSGRLKLFIGNSISDLTELNLEPGQSVSIAPGVIHRMEALETSEYLEASTPELKDVIRLSDDYRRE